MATDPIRDFLKAFLNYEFKAWPLSRLNELKFGAYEEQALADVRHDDELRRLGAPVPDCMRVGEVFWISSLLRQRRERPDLVGIQLAYRLHVDHGVDPVTLRSMTAEDARMLRLRLDAEHRRTYRDEKLRARAIAIFGELGITGDVPNTPEMRELLRKARESIATLLGVETLDDNATFSPGELCWIVADQTKRLETGRATADQVIRLESLGVPADEARELDAANARLKISLRQLEKTANAMANQPR